MAGTSDIVGIVLGSLAGVCILFAIYYCKKNQENAAAIRGQQPRQGRRHRGRGRRSKDINRNANDDPLSGTVAIDKE